MYRVAVEVAHRGNSDPGEPVQLPNDQIVYQQVRRMDHSVQATSPLATGVQLVQTPRTGTHLRIALQHRMQSSWAGSTECLSRVGTAEHGMSTGMSRGQRDC
jgi:hypothetical protein